jgi:hypothetical protein
MVRDVSGESGEGVGFSLFGYKPIGKVPVMGMEREK